MSSAHSEGQANAAHDQYRALLAVSEAIGSHRDLAALFHALAGQLHPVVRFDYLGLLLHEAEGNLLRLHVVEPPGPTPVILPVGEVPAGLVFESQKPLILSSVAEYKRWPRLQELAWLYGVQSACWLSLSTARRQLGTLSFACKQPAAVDRDRREVSGARLSARAGVAPPCAPGPGRSASRRSGSSPRSAIRPR